MTFKDSSSDFQIIDVALIDPDPQHPRQNIDESSLKGLANSIEKMGVIHPLVVRPANAAGRYTVIVGERRRRAAILAGERTVPVIVRACTAAETLEVQVFENIGLGVRAPLEAREMANAIQTIAARFASPDEAAQHFGRAPTWLAQATAAANLSEKVTALLDAGKISSTGAAVQLERLAKKNEAKAEVLIDRIGQLPEGEKVSKKVVDNALSEVTCGRKKKESVVADDAVPVASASDIPPWEELPDTPQITSARRRISQDKVKLVAELLGLEDGDEEEVLIRLIDEFLAQKNS
ncbi:MAG: ParB/RepB/Spo0J family partition protein [Gammaproteobacteria bacterium]|nr:ParB/RepB/Spo0J family partition protein [Gammaproteobacteria bacterium]MBU1602362.1 ParB/RepB/Spo0J family partition protein [Gammaproteobacteria bacterium]MBU2433168.1 ParB/RepB/Spo0J family partition protein [Gammaproteobacteria bacterium]MBU2451083.1 ParB/RepB/Spo0J family partition protein [Gammaproteobacteria bacterium]